MYSYRVYELTINSEIEIPELSTGPGFAPVSPYVCIRFSDIPAPGRLDPDITSRAMCVGPDEVVYERQDCGRFLVRSGREILVSPFSGVEERVLRLSLFGPVLGLLLIQRGKLVLHGAAVAFGDQALVLLGPGGVGKSTLTAEFCRLGGQLLTDDVVVIEDPCGSPRARAGAPLIKLWPDAARQAPPCFTRSVLHPGYDKLGCRVPDTALAHPTAIHSIHVLQFGDSISQERLSGVRSFEALMASLFAVRYGRQFVQNLDGKKLLEHVGGLADRVPVHILRRPHDRKLLRATAEMALTGLEPADDPV